LEGRSGREGFAADPLLARLHEFKQKTKLAEGRSGGYDPQTPKKKDLVSETKSLMLSVQLVK
jgi:hypothetical protein